MRNTQLEEAFDKISMIVEMSMTGDDKPEHSEIIASAMAFKPMYRSDMMMWAALQYLLASKTYDDPTTEVMQLMGQTFTDRWKTIGTELGPLMDVAIKAYANG